MDDPQVHRGELSDQAATRVVEAQAQAWMEARHDRAERDRHRRAGGSCPAGTAFGANQGELISSSRRGAWIGRGARVLRKIGAGAGAS